MRYIKILILGTWFLPVFLLISPFHEYDNKASIKYILLILLVIVFIVIPLKDRKIEIKNSVLLLAFQAQKQSDPELPGLEPTR